MAPYPTKICHCNLEKGLKRGMYGPAFHGSENPFSPKQRLKGTNVEKKAKRKT